LADFADEAKKIALCAPQVPCGAASEKVFAAAQIIPRPDTLEQDVKATLAKVAADEVDAALVYKTDVIDSPDEVDGVDFAESDQAVSQYPIATLTASPAPEVSQAFVDYVLSPEAQAVLSKAGFAQP
jgi:molybdate transport system substrate-binding protein